MTFRLHTELVAAPEATPKQLAFVLHGVFGSSANWRMFTRSLAKERPAWGFVLCDLRGHARSLGALPPHNLDAMADDLENLESAFDSPIAAVIGHSLGGKVALAYALRGRPKLAQTWVLDSQPGALPFSGMTIEVLEMLERLPRVFADRQDFLRDVKAAGHTDQVAAWLAMNVRRDGDELVLKLELPAIRAILEDYYRTNYWAQLERLSGLHMVVGTESFIWNDDDAARLARLEETSGAAVHRVAAGHWVNVDAPDELRDLFLSTL